MQQDIALEVLKTGVNAFVTGEPGSGKTYTINTYIQWLQENDIEPAVTASTGIAATHIGGSTIHSYSGLGARGEIDEYGLDELSQKEYLVKRLERTTVLIIEEVSMLDARVLDSVDEIFRTLRQKSEPFGGVQVILVGDFFQLPPVRPGDTPHFAFKGESWRDAKPVTCYLTEQWRQEDQNFLDLLTAMRNRKCDDTHIIHLKKRLIKQESEIDTTATKLYSHNADVDTINNKELQKCKTPSHVFEMKKEGAKKLIEQLMRGCLSPDTLVLKKGAVVMFTKNNFDVGFVNGTVGIVKEFNSFGNPVIYTTDGQWIEVEPMDWTVEDNGKIRAKLTQYPLRLAWAITVHKSQGMSLSTAVVDLSHAFEYGQGYVALSRVRSLDGLYLMGFNERALEVHPDVANIDSYLRRHSLALEMKYKEKSREEIEQRQNAFLKKVYAVGYRKKAHEKTGELLSEYTSISAIARARGIKPGTVIDHLQKLVDEEKISSGDIRHLWDGSEEDLEIIHEALYEAGTTKLSPVRKHLNNQFSYDTIKFARILFPS